MLNEIVKGLKALVTGGDASGTAEKRRFLRLKCHYRMTCAVDKQAFACTVLDLGLRGMRVETRERLRPGQTVYVTYTPESQSVAVDTVKCRVVWCRTLQTERRERIGVGLRFEDTSERIERSWVKATMLELGVVEQKSVQHRKERRAMAMLPAQARVAGPEPVPVTILNLGAGGALINTSEKLEKGSDLTLVVGPAIGLPVMVISGVVVSTRYEPLGESYFCGVSFGLPGSTSHTLVSSYVKALLKKPPETP